MGITAGEYPPIMAAQRLIHSINLEQLHGVVILVQSGNLTSFQGRSLYLNPLDRKNLN